MVFGEILIGFVVGMDVGDWLSLEYFCWLMGYLVVWGCLGVMVM